MECDTCMINPIWLVLIVAFFMALLGAVLTTGEPNGTRFICPKCRGNKVKLVLGETLLESKQVCPDCGFESEYDEWF